MIKTQVIIDGNYLLFKNVFILHKLRERELLHHFLLISLFLYLILENQIGENLFTKNIREREKKILI